MGGMTLSDVETQRRHPPASVVAAATVLAVKAALGLWAGVVLLTASPSHHRSFLGQVIRERHRSTGVLLLVLVAASAIVVFGLVRLRPWAWVAALALEGVGVVLALSRIGSRPGAAVLSLALSAG